MGLLNPVYGLVVPFLCFFTIPLAIFAGITTTFAFSILMLRVATVYLEIALQMVPQYITGRSSYLGLPTPYRGTHSYNGARSPISPVGSLGSAAGSNLASPTSATTPLPGLVGSGYKSPRHRSAVALAASGGSAGFPIGERRSRRSSQASMISVGTISPMREGAVTPALAGAALMPSTGLDRDFEGLGGWRLDDRGDHGDWGRRINSRLELPMPTERPSTRTQHRSHSGGATTPSDGGFLMMKGSRREMDDGDFAERISVCVNKASMSPNSSRLRMNQGMAAPAALTALDEERADGYFPPLSSLKTSKKVAA